MPTDRTAGGRSGLCANAGPVVEKWTELGFPISFGEIGMDGLQQLDRTAREAALGSAAGRELVTELRYAKQVAGLSFARLESLTPYSRASLERYVNGKLFPSRHAVAAITQVCQGDTLKLVALWETAVRAGRAPAAGGSCFPTLPHRPDEMAPLNESLSPAITTVMAEHLPNRLLVGTERRMMLVIAVIFAFLGGYWFATRRVRPMP